jgi:tRNA U34 5-methylaminomethyl-2-thiouridine-forming methyltransferase MnmC
MEKIITPDGSVTLHIEEFDEAMHSKSGAKEESLLKFVEPCQIKELAATGRIRILDVCFGLGYNSAMAIDVALAVNPDCVIEVVGLESSQEIVQTICTLENSFDCYDLFKAMVQNDYRISKGNISIKVLLGDATETIKKVDGMFDVCFFDPFSPKKCPELWSEEMFRSVYTLLKKNGRIATYSCARVVRDNMKAVGFSVSDGVKLHRRGPSTVGVKE